MALRLCTSCQTSIPVADFPAHCHSPEHCRKHRDCHRMMWGNPVRAAKENFDFIREHRRPYEKGTTLYELQQFYYSKEHAARARELKLPTAGRNAIVFTRNWKRLNDGEDLELVKNLPSGRPLRPCDCGPSGDCFATTGGSSSDAEEESVTESTSTAPSSPPNAPVPNDKRKTVPRISRKRQRQEAATSSPPESPLPDTTPTPSLDDMMNAIIPFLRQQQDVHSVTGAKARSVISSVLGIDKKLIPDEILDRIATWAVTNANGSSSPRPNDGGTTPSAAPSLSPTMDSRTVVVQPPIPAPPSKLKIKAPIAPPPLHRAPLPVVKLEATPVLSVKVENPLEAKNGGSDAEGRRSQKHSSPPNNTPRTPPPPPIPYTAGSNTRDLPRNSHKSPSPPKEHHFTPSTHNTQLHPTPSASVVSVVFKKKALPAPQPVPVPVVTLQAKVLAAMKLLTGYRVRPRWIAKQPDKLRDSIKALEQQGIDTAPLWDAVRVISETRVPYCDWCISVDHDTRSCREMQAFREKTAAATAKEHQLPHTSAQNAPPQSPAPDTPVAVAPGVLRSVDHDEEFTNAMRWGRCVLDFACLGWCELPRYYHALSPWDASRTASVANSMDHPMCCPWLDGNALHDITSLLPPPSQWPAPLP